MNECRPASDEQVWLGGPGQLNREMGNHGLEGVRTMRNQIVLGTVLLCAFVQASFGVIVGFQGIGAEIVQDVSGDGLVVVGSTGSEAFRWTQDSGIVGLGDLPGGDFESNAMSVSADGSVIVGRGESCLGDEAFRWTAETGMVGLGDFFGGGHSSIAYGVSADGSIVVGRGSSTSGLPSGTFRWMAETGMQALGDLQGGFSGSAYGVSSDGSVIVGSSLIGDDLQGAFRWWDINGNGVVDPDEKLDDHAEFRLFHEIWTRAYSASADGSVVVGYGRDGAFRWTSNNGTVGLGDLPGGDVESVALDVSADGSVVVGWSETGTNRHEPFVWDEINGMQNLSHILVSDYGLDLTGWTLTSAQAISDDGLTIVGRGVNPAGAREGWIATIPEPGTVLLLGLGAVVLRRKSQDGAKCRTL